MKIRTLTFLLLFLMALIPLGIQMSINLPAVSEKFTELIREENKSRLKANLAPIKSRISDWKNKVKLLGLIPGTLDLAAQKEASNKLPAEIIQQRYVKVATKWFINDSELQHINIFSAKGDNLYHAERNKKGNIIALLHTNKRQTKNKVYQEEKASFCSNLMNNTNLKEEETKATFHRHLEPDFHNENQKKGSHYHVVISTPLYRKNNYLGQLIAVFSIDDYINRYLDYHWVNGVGNPIILPSTDFPDSSGILHDLINGADLKKHLKKNIHFQLKHNNVSFSWEPLIINTSPNESIWVGSEDNVTEIELWLNRLNNRAGAIVIVVIILTVILARWFSKKLQSYNQTVIKGLNNMLQKKQPMNLRWRWPKEMEILSTELNKTSNNYLQSEQDREEAEAELKQINEYLEDTIQSRTEELSQTNTALLESMEELRNTQKELIIKEKMATLGALSSGVAHEIKNPLNFINNFAQLSVEITEELAESGAKFLENPCFEFHENLKKSLEELNFSSKTILKHGERADLIMSDMLQHFKGKTELPESQPLPDIIQHGKELALHEINRSYPNLNLQIKEQIGNDLPKVFVGFSSISRVIINLITNAAYALNEKAAKQTSNYTPRITIIAEKDTVDCIKLIIEDNGLGIEDGNQAKIFDPFFTTKPTGSGTGLGLFICYDIISSEHKGKMQVESKQGEYTRFIIHLPCKDKASKQSP